MPEIVLRRLFGGAESARGTAATPFNNTAYRKLYGMLEPSRNQDRRFAVEDRGTMVDKYRTNAKTVEAGFRFSGDATFEDVPWWSTLGLAGTPTAATGNGTSLPYTYVYVPDLTADTIRTATLIWGDESTQFQGPFGTVDTLDYAMTLDDALKLTAGGFVTEWFPTGQNAYAGGYPTSVAERAVESVMGWEHRLYLDPGATAVGTTQITGRFISAQWSYHNQNKRKFFGDNVTTFQRLGRGRRQVQCEVVFEAVDMTQVQDLFDTNQNMIAGALPNERALRVSAVGSPLSGVSYGNTSGSLVAGTPITTVPCTALANPIPARAVLQIGVNGPQVTVSAAGAIATATTVPIDSFTPRVTVATTQAMIPCKKMDFDFWGYWMGNPTFGARDTNATFSLTLMGVYDTTQATECKVTVTNGVSTVLV